MGRPWWYDSYPTSEYKPERRFRLPGRKLWVWSALLLACLLLAMNRTGFQPVWPFTLISFVSFLCQALALAILVRTLLSWFSASRYNPFLNWLEDLTGPVLLPLRRVVPAFGMFDITPIVAMVILYVMPSILNCLVS